MATGNCPGDNTEKTAAAKAKVRTDIKGCLYPRRSGVLVRACGSEFTRLFAMFIGYQGCYQHVADSGLVDNTDCVCLFFTYRVLESLNFKSLILLVMYVLIYAHKNVH